MAKIEINRITNANIYLDGANLLGRAEEVKLPDVSMTMQEHKALGMVGKVELPAGFDKMEGEIKWNSFYRDAMLSAANPYKSLALQCRSSVQRYSSQGLIDEIPLVTFLTIMFKKNPLGTFKQHENAEFSSSFTCTYIKQVLDGEELLELDYWDGFEATFGVDYAEHARIEGKPGLQFVGDKLDEIQISLVFHQHYCVPDMELARLRTAMKSHQALALVFGNGDYRGWFVITDVTATSEQTDSTGNVLAVNATASLREYIGDPKNPLQPPAIHTQVPGVGAVSGAVPSPSGVAQYVRDGVNYAKQAQSVLQTTISAVRVAQKMKDNPAVALTRVPGLMSGLGNVSGALGQSVPAFNALSESMPDAVSLARATSDAATYVQQAQSSLNGVDGSNIAAALDAVSGQLNSASSTFTRMSPGLSTMAAKILARSV